MEKKSKKKTSGRLKNADNSSVVCNLTIEQKVQQLQNSAHDDRKRLSTDESTDDKKWVKTNKIQLMSLHKRNDELTISKGVSNDWVNIDKLTSEWTNWKWWCDHKLMCDFSFESDKKQQQKVKIIENRRKKQSKKQSVSTLQSVN